MKRALALLAAGLAMPAGIAVANVAGGGPPPPPSCKPYQRHCPPPTHTQPTSSTVTVTVPGTTVTEPGTTITEPGTTTTIIQPSAPPTVVVTPGPTSQTVNITITINGVPETITVPGTVPSASKACVNTRRTAQLGPLPFRFHRGLHVAVRVNGNQQLRTVGAGRKVSVNLPAACGPVAFVVNDVPNTRAIRPVLRIWLLEGGNRIVRVGSPLPVPPIGLS